MTFSDLNDRVTVILADRRRFAALFGLGCALLALTHFQHSAAALAAQTVYPDLGASAQSGPLIEIIHTSILIYLFALYFLTLFNWSRLNFRLRDLIWIGIPIGLLAWITLPANSTDVLMYIALGRIAGVYGANPYLHTYYEFADDYTPYVEWDLPMPYGPVMLPFFIPPGWISQFSVVGAIYLTKLFWLLISVGNCWLLYLILKSEGRDAGRGVFIFGFNPLVLLELIINGHNDGVLIFFGLLAFWALRREWFASALLLAFLAVLVKFSGVFICLGVAIYLLRKKRWKEIGLATVASLASSLLFMLTLFPTIGDAKNLMHDVPYAQNSLHYLLIEFIMQMGARFGNPLDFHEVLTLDRRVFALIFFGFCLWRLSIIRDFSGLVREVGLVLMALLIGYAAWFFPWYATWLLPFAVLTEDDRLKRVIIIFSLTVTALYAFPHWLITEAPGHWVWDTLRILIVHAVPLGLVVFWRLNRTHQLVKTADLQL